MFTLRDLHFPVPQGTLIYVYDTEDRWQYTGSDFFWLPCDCLDKAVVSLEQTEDTIKIHIER